MAAAFVTAISVWQRGLFPNLGCLLESSHALVFSCFIAIRDIRVHKLVQLPETCKLLLQFPIIKLEGPYGPPILVQLQVLHHKETR